MQKTLGIMIDCSRNAVMRPEKVKEFAKTISDMGYNMLQLYTEDTYEMEGEPFFGHFRGRYSQEELKDIDAYCASIGVELVPCIQTLAHLNQIKQWVPYGDMFDCNDILMAGDERVYDLIEKMFATLDKCFISRRVNVGMDEAHFLGRGRYQDEHGYRNRVDILTEHLARVKEIAEKYGFTLMMWSDMFIRLHCNGEYYGENIKIPQETIDNVPEGIELIYWDYYSKDKNRYDHMLKTHLDFNNPIGFAGGIWTWTGYVPNMAYSMDATEAAMRSVTEHTVDTVFFTMWGDDGKDCSYFSMIPVLFAAAQMAQGNFDRKDIADKFAEKYGYIFEEFMNLELPNITKEEESHYHNPSKYLLYNDPFLGTFDFTVSEDLWKRYAVAKELLATSINGRKYDYLFDMEAKLLEVLALKADLGTRIRKAYTTGDKVMLQTIVDEDMPRTRQAIKVFAESFRTLWLTENKPFGLEVQEQRLGGMMYRMETCEMRLRDYLSGKLACIEELDADNLDRWEGFAGEGVTYNNWKQTVTVSVI